MLHILSPSRFVHKGLTHSHIQAIRESISSFFKVQEIIIDFHKSLKNILTLLMNQAHKQNMCVYVNASHIYRMSNCDINMQTISTPIHLKHFQK